MKPMTTEIKINILYRVHQTDIHIVESDSAECKTSETECTNIDITLCLLLGTLIEMRGILNIYINNRIVG